jgi:hypothetical protein
MNDHPVLKDFLNMSSGGSRVVQSQHQQHRRTGSQAVSNLNPKQQPYSMNTGKMNGQNQIQQTSQTISGLANRNNQNESPNGGPQYQADQGINMNLHAARVQAI